MMCLFWLISNKKKLSSTKDEQDISFNWQKQDLLILEK